MGRQSRRVLVVEDDQMLRETIGEVMVDIGHEVRLAGNGREALVQLEGWPADLIILDLMMPLMDAYEFHDRQREHAAGRPAKVLVLSAAHDVAEAAERLGATAWMAKPFNLGSMLETVDRLLESSPGQAAGVGAGPA